MERRSFLAGAAALYTARLMADEVSKPSRKVYIFSKHLQFLQGDALAVGAAEIGFDGIDITVRDKGHVEPAVVAQELPRLVGIIRKHGLEVPMITAGIVDADSPHAEDILKTMSSLGIRKYRWGGFKYDLKQPMAPQFEELRRRIQKLAALNAKYQVTAMYHTHSGVGQAGASVWDLYMLLKEFDPKSVALNYDIGHATIEGGLGGWIHSLRGCAPYIAGVAVKDFLWQKNAKGVWNADWCPMGEGMVHLPQFFQQLNALQFSGPVQMHVEYKLGGAENGNTTISLSKEQVFAAMKKDLAVTRAAMAA